MSAARKKSARWSAKKADLMRDSDVLPLPGGHRVEVRIRRSRRARRILLHVGLTAGEVELVLPHRVSRLEGFNFARSKAGWVARRLRHVRPAVPFKDGSEIPFLGRPLRILHLPARRGVVRRELFDLVVAGTSHHVAGLVEGWLREEALREIGRRAREKARSIARQVQRIAVRDPRTRWGSCSPDGSLSFSWRLMLAPDYVLDYVVAHEVAHLVHLNHGKRFWRLVAELCTNADGARRWLREHGNELHRYG